MNAREHLQSALQARTSGEAARWFDAASRDAASSSRDRLLAVYAESSLRLGRLPLAMSATADFPPPGAEGLSVDDWTLEDAARAVFLLTRAETSSDDAFEGDANGCYDFGDAREQRSWLRAVALLPRPERFLLPVIDACRTNILPVFEAVACGNPYAASYFPELNFNQLVMKALFNGVRLERIVGLVPRTNAELARMAMDFAAERRAAGRSVPADIGLVTTGAAA